jgi:hypothetical protein
VISNIHFLAPVEGPMIIAKHRACPVFPLLESRLRAGVSSARYGESLYGILGQLLLVSDRDAHPGANSGRKVCKFL